MGVEGDDNILSVVEIIAHVFYLGSINVRHGKLNGNRQVDDDLIVGSGLPDVDNGVTYLQCELRLCACEAFRRILENKVAGSLFSVLSTELCTLNSYLDYLFLALSEYLLTLCNGSRVVEVNHSVLAACKSFKGLCDNMLSCLSEHLYPYIIGYHVSFDKLTAELIFCLGSCGEAYLYLLEADIYQLFEKFQLFFQAHGNDKSLVSVSQVNGTPHGSVVDIFLLCPLHALNGGHKISSCVLRCVHCNFLL